MSGEILKTEFYKKKKNSLLTCHLYNVFSLQPSTFPKQNGMQKTFHQICIFTDIRISKIFNLPLHINILSSSYSQKYFLDVLRYYSVNWKNNNLKE